MPNPVTLIVAHPKELIRAGLRAMLGNSRIKIVAEVNDAAQTLTLTKKHKPAVVLMDVAIPDGDSFELVKKLRETLTATRFILISAIDNPTYTARAHAAGASNYLLNSIDTKELIAAIEDAAAGKPAPSAGVFGKVVAAMETKQQATKAAGSVLTPREEQVLRHVAFGLSNQEIASSLAIGVDTVKEHVENVVRKLAVKDRTHAAVRALQTGLA